jgi:signal transduction histidine kinase
MALKARDFDARSVVKTGDEFEELSDSLNAAAEELAGYSKAQRDFLDNISHELKTPLMSIQGYAEGIRDGVFNADDQTLGIITDESIRLKKLVGEISYLSKLESMPDFYKKTNRDVKEIIEKAIDSAAGLQNARKIKIVPLNIESRTVVCDQEKILQLMINILSNSLRYAKNAVFIDTQIKNDCYMITVKDDGPGLSPGEEDNIFRRFYKGPGGNTGLGLSISLAIAQNHGGTITAWNTAPYGAVFEITLSLV